MSLFDDISYSDLGSAGRDLFLAEFSDVLFYFEDAEYEPVYEKLISIIAPNLLTNAIICAGGKTNVLALARSKNDVGKPRVFIVDKDFDDILGEIRDEIGLIYLERYCFENYLISFSAIINVIIDRFSLRGSVAHKATEDFSVFFARILTQYERLTRLFLVARKNRLAIQTTKMPANEFASGEAISDILPLEFVETYTTRLLESALTTCDWITPGPVLENLLSSAFEFKQGSTPANDRIERHFCGKHLFLIIKRYFELALGVSLLDIPSSSLYMDIMGRIDGLADDLDQTRRQICETVERQRTHLYS